MRIGHASKVIWANTDNITKWIQVVALVFAAVWTFWKFFLTEVPSLQTPLQVQASVRKEWHQEPAPGACWVLAVFNVANQGVKSFDVAFAEVRTWRVTLPARDGNYAFVDVTSHENDTPLTHTHLASPIAGHYAPKKGVIHTLSWIFYGPPSSDLLLTQIVLFDKSNEPVGQASAWNQICE